MNATDLMAALSSAQSNPMFNTGLGMLQASGPHFGAPTSLGQALAAGQQYQQAAQAKQMQNQIMGYQAQRASYLNNFIRQGLGGMAGQGQSPVANPNADPALAATAGIRAQDATDPTMSGMVYGSNGFTNGISATPAQIGSQGTPTVSGAGAAALGLQQQAAQGQPQPSAAQAAQQQAPQGTPGSSGTGGVGAAMLKDPMYYLAFGLDPNAATTSYLNQQYPQPTDVQKLIQERQMVPSGSPQAQALDMAIAKNSGALVNLRQGGMFDNLLTGQHINAPRLPQGAVYDPVQNAVSMLPGSLGAIGQSTAAQANPKAAATAQYKPFTVTGPQGQPITTTALNAPNMLGTPTTTGAPANQSQMDQKTAMLASLGNAMVKAGIPPAQIDQTLAHMQVPGAVNAGAPAGAIAGPAAGFATGQNALANLNAKNFQQTIDQGKEAALRMNVLDNIVNLSEQGVKTGPGSEWQNDVLGHLANVPGLGSVMSGAQGNVAKFQEVQKFLNQAGMRSWQAAGGTGTDTQLEQALHSNPNSAQFPQALQTITRWVKAGDMAAQTKANAQQAYFNQNGRDMTNMDQFESQWRQHYDPRVFQLDAMAPQDQVSFIKGLKPNDAAKLMQDRQYMKPYMQYGAQ